MSKRVLIKRTPDEWRALFAANEASGTGAAVFCREHCTSRGDPNAGITANVIIAYDILGRKVSMTDPDMGVWSYAYNAFGELTIQTNA